MLALDALEEPTQRTGISLFLLQDGVLNYRLTY